MTKKIPPPSKKSSTLRLRLLHSLRQYFVKKLTLEGIKNIQIDGGLGGYYCFVNDLRNLPNLKIYRVLWVFVPTIAYLLRLSDKTCTITFTVLGILFISVLP